MGLTRRREEAKAKQPPAHYNRGVNAETAYLFRHALLRDAAYQLQVPSDRARLHALALVIVEHVLGGAPAPPANPFEDIMPPHATDVAAAELAFHARQAAGAGLTAEEAAQKEILYLWRAGRFAQKAWLPSEAIECMSRIIEHPRAPLVWRAAACLRAAVSLRTRGQPKAAEERVLQGLAWAREGGSREGEMHLLDLLGTARRDLSQLNSSNEAFAAALALALALNDVARQGIGHGQLAVNRVRRGELVEAERGYRSAIALALEAKDRRREGAWTGALASVLRMTGRMDESEAAFNRAIELMREAGDRQNEGIFLCNSGALFEHQGKYAEAKARFEAGLKLARQAGDRATEGLCLGNLGVVAHEQGDEATAEPAFLEALEVARQSGDSESEHLWLGNLGNVMKKTGRRLEAVNNLRAAAEYFRRSGQRTSESVWRGNLAAALKDLDQRDSAREEFDRALGLARAVGYARIEGCWLASLAALDAEQGLEERARESWRAARALLEQSRAGKELREARETLKKAAHAAGIVGAWIE